MSVDGKMIGTNLFRVYDVHDDTTLEHTSESCLDGEAALAAFLDLGWAVAIDAVGDGEIVGHCGFRLS